ncbi:LysR substrate-binding domain-containing protein [Aliiglaciecola lipolytica]|uniref:Regulatory protein LysR:LysR substrate-binding n=1 Tax=Aliiglaciecola lipolytica E3 TaxID=1127673 RepID=K6YPS2_9ALTE|nr:LysR substrate-binding domain-containing protein [Aliiglaciecola lipolytica]GAC13290.1 regulatory protein LysR:LysR substrate-binding [Aliiglaciecola lipolytica E3]|tara:strand:+ start:348 stop:1214 length:867 start_codon:yes stop_codon:yes gene_type:complete
MQWEGISEFVSVAENQSFTLGAKKIAVSTGHASRQISSLEQRLNVKLFYRTTRKVSLTEEGKVFYQHCRSVLDGLNEAERAITNLQSMPRGLVKLTAPVTYGESVVLPLINDFLQKYSEVEVTSYLSNRKINIIDEGYDLAIRLGNLEDSSLMAKKLGSRKNYVCASPSYLNKYGVPHSLSELEKHRCLLGTLDYWRFNEQNRERNIRLTGVLRYNSGFGLVDAALKGLGVVQLPDYYVNSYIKSGELVTILDNFIADAEGIWAVYPHNRQLSPKIRLLVDFIAENLA